MRMHKIILLFLIVLLLITLTACSKTKPDNNLERLWESLIAQEHTNGVADVAYGELAAGIDRA